MATTQKKKPVAKSGKTVKKVSKSASAKKISKKVVVKKRPVKKAEVKKASVKKSAVKKTPAKKAAVTKKAASSKKTSTKVAAKKPIAKKSAVAKPSTRKASTTKKAVAKKAATTKAASTRTVKKVTTTRAVTKRAAAPKRPVKRVSSTPRSRSVARIQSIPEVPIRKSVTSTPTLNAPSQNPVRSIEATRSTEAFFEKAPNQDKSSKSSKRDRALLVVSALIVVIAGIVAFAVPSSNEKSVADGSSAPAAQASETPSPVASETADSMTDGSNSAEGSTPTTTNSFALRYTYNSIGITLNMQAAQSLGSVKEYVVRISENGGDAQIFGTYAGDTSAVRIAKIDTVGTTTFTVEATLSDGTKVSSAPLAIRGLFAAE